MADKRYEVIVTDQAIEQLEATKQYYTFKLHAKDAANDFIDLMEETFIDLESFPKRGRPVPDEPWHSEGVRMRPIKNHIVYYWIDEDELKVWITAVIDERMDQKKQLKKMKMK